MTIKKILLSILLFITWLQAGVDGTSNIWIVTQGNTLKQYYYNSTTTNIRLTFTVDEAFSTLQAYGVKTAANTDIAGCSESQFAVGTPLVVSGGSTTWSPGGGFASGTTYTLDISTANIKAGLAGGAFTEGGRLYIGIRFGLNNNDWSCPANTNGNSDGDGTNDSAKGNNAYYYHLMDDVVPTLASITDHSDKNLNSTAGTTGAVSNYTNSPDGAGQAKSTTKITTGGEAAQSIKMTWTKDAGVGATIGAKEINGGSTNASTSITHDENLVNATRYDITYTIEDIAGNIGTYTDHNIWFDNAAPTVTGVVSEESNGDMLSENTKADFYVQFNETTMDYTGAPALSILQNTGSALSLNAAVFADGSDKVYYDWTVPDGAYSKFLDYENTTALTAASGGSIKDYAGNAATLTLPAPPNWGSQGGNASLSGAGTGGYFGVDGDDPADDSVEDIVTVGGNVVAGKWNATNTSVNVSVPLADDESLVDGTIQLRAEADGGFEDIGDLYTIVNADRNGTKVLSVTAAQVGGLAGFTDGDVLEWTAIVTDKSGNATTYTKSSTTLTVGLNPPLVVSVLGSNNNTAIYRKLNETIDMVVAWNDANSGTVNVTVSGGTPQLRFNTDNAPGTNDALVDFTSGSGSSNLTFTYTVGATHYSTDLDYESTTALSLNGAAIKDAEGNTAVLTLPAVGTLAAARNIVIDGVAPAAFQVGSVVTNTAAVVAGYWNIANTAIDVEIPIANDVSLSPVAGDGKVYIQAKTGANAFATIKTDDIETGEVNTTKTVNVAAAALEAIADFGDVGETVTFTAILEDLAGGPGGTGNKTTGTESGTTLVIDQVAPVAFRVGAVTTITEPVVAGKWNMHNTAVSVVVPITDEASVIIGTTTKLATGGTVQVIAKTADGNYENIGDPVTIAAGDLGGNITVTISALILEAIDTAVIDGDVITFNAIITDKAGNPTTGTSSATTLTVDQTPPEVDEVTSDAADGDDNAYKVGATVEIKVSFDEIVNIVTDNGTPSLQLDTDNNPGSVLSEAIYNKDTGSKFPIFLLTVATNNYAKYLNYRATTSLVLNNGTLRDDAGNNAVLTLPPLGDATALMQKKDLWIDGVLPTKLRVGALLTTGSATDTLVAGYWNATNTGLNVVVPLETTDESLIGGTIQLQAQAIGAGVTGIWTNLGAVTPMSTTTVGAGTQTVLVPNSGANPFEDINNLSEQNPNDVVTVRAIVIDKAGNSETYNISNTTITVDQTYPSTPASYKPSAIKTGIAQLSVDATYSMYWNQTHHAILITAPFTNDATLEGGYLQFQARAGANGAWIPVGFRKTITAAQVASGDDLTYAFDDVTTIQDRIQPDGTANRGGDDEEEFGVDKIAGFDNEKDMYFRVMVADRAGNSIYSDISDVTIYIEERSPTISEVTSSSADGAYKEGDKVNLQVLSETVYAAEPVMTVTGTPQLKLETGAIADAVVNYTSGSGSRILLFEYTVAAGHNSVDLNYFDINALELNAGTIKDPYGNSVTLELPALNDASALMQKKDIEIDTTPPSVTFTYDDPDSLVRFEDATMVITATFSDDIEFNTVPILTVDFPNNTAGDKANLSMYATTTKIFTYNVPLVDDSDGQIALSVTANDKALNALIADSVFADSIITIDNTDPIAFTTGLMTLFGDTVSGSWFNKSTDSVRVLVPVDVADQSLLRGNITIQMQVDGKMTTDSWATILPKDSLQVLAASISKYRTKKEVLDILTPQKLAQGDSVFVRALINDQVGNSTIGATSASFFILDTIPPALIAGKSGLITLTDRPDTTISNLSGETIFLTSLRNGNNNDTLWTNDSLNFATSNWEDPKLEAEVARSGIRRYEYSLMESADNDSAGVFTTFRSYKFQTSLLDTVIIAHDSLRHNRWYYPRLRAVDIAGNESGPILFYKTFRHNARPIVDTIPQASANEDVLWEQVLEINDRDVATLRSDKFFYTLESYFSDTTQTPWAIVAPKIDTINAAVSVAGKVSFTPTKWDTAAYIHRVIITDDWGLKDTIDIEMRVNAVNDPPVINLSAIKKLIFNEGTSSDSINLTRYAYDEDNLTSSLKYSFKIASKLAANIGYPTAKIGFLSNFSNKYKNKLITDLVDEYPLSTIIQKNNSLVIYPGSISDFKDPIKVDSLSQIGGAIDSLYAWITQTDAASADTNYYTEYDMIVEYTVIDPSGLEGKDTVTFFIDALNDPPVWSGLNDTIVNEGESIYLDFANYLTDVDDSTLTISILPLTYDSNVTVEPNKTFEKKATGYTYSSKARKDKVKFTPQAHWFESDGKFGLPDLFELPNREKQKSVTPIWNGDSTSAQIKFKITAADDDTSAVDTFIVKVQRVPRPGIRMYVVQNNAFTKYFEVFLVDSVGKTRDLTLNVQSAHVDLDTAAAFTYVAHHNFTTPGDYSFEVYAEGVVGDTLIDNSFGLTLAKMYGNWSGSSADGQFHVLGANGSVDFDQAIMIVDSTLFQPHFNDRASYLLGNEGLRFSKEVEVSMPGDDEETAIYRLSTGSGWVELPSYIEGSRVNAYSDKMGYFRLGPKTLTVPGQTSLKQNYPNPFNPSTTIEYDLGFIDGAYQKVNITVYDIMGRNIKVLVNDEKSIGRYNVRWSGKDQNGVQVSSGVYFIHLITDMGRSQTKKIMLMR